MTTFDTAYADDTTRPSYALQLLLVAFEKSRETGVLLEPAVVDLVCETLANAIPQIQLAEAVAEQWAAVSRARRTGARVSFILPIDPPLCARRPSGGGDAA